MPSCIPQQNCQKVPDGGLSTPSCQETGVPRSTCPTQAQSYVDKCTVAAVCRPSQEPLILALFALLHLQIPLCKQTADLLQQQTADWGLQHWDLSAFQLSMEGKGASYHADCLSCVGIPL
jgi:hypothetical protein